MNATTSTLGAQGLVPVFAGQIKAMPVQLCDARLLHAFLQVGRRFATWITERIKEYGFVENFDFICFPDSGSKLEASNSLNGETKKHGGHNRKEYHLTLDMAKELAMVERNDQGRMIRRYFIECERKLMCIAKAARAPRRRYNFPIAATKPHDHDPALNNDTLSPRVLLDPRNRALEVELLDQLQNDGHDVSGAKLRIIALHQVAARFMRVQARMGNWAERMGALIDELGCYGREEGCGVLYCRPLDPNSMDSVIYKEQLAALGVAP